MELTRAVTYCLAKDMLLISTVEKTGFKAMLQLFYPRYQLPSRNYFNRIAIPAMVNEVKGEIDQQIQNKELSHFSGTTDLGPQLLGIPSSLTLALISTLSGRCNHFASRHTTYLKTTQGKISRKPCWLHLSNGSVQASGNYNG